MDSKPRQVSYEPVRAVSTEHAQMANNNLSVNQIDLNYAEGSIKKRPTGWHGQRSNAAKLEINTLCKQFLTVTKVNIQLIAMGVFFLNNLWNLQDNFCLTIVGIKSKFGNIYTHVKLSQTHFSKYCEDWLSGI